MKKGSWLTQIIRSLTPTRETFAASPVSERNVTQGVDWSGLYRDRYNYDRQQILEQSLQAWRLNPLARRIVELQTQYITDGIEFRCDDPATEQFLREFWSHPLNRIGEHLKEWADELSLTGNLFPILTTDAAGMTYLRIHPSDLVAEIEAAPNDIQQERAYICKPSAVSGELAAEPERIPNYWASERQATPRQAAAVAHSGDTSHRSRAVNRKSPLMLHYAVNRLAGMLWGEPDLAPLLPWLSRYAAWLEDRVRLNRFRQAYLYVVKGRFASRLEREARQRELAYNPPNPGSILVTDDSEEWDVLAPKLDSFDANADGMALKKFILGGRGYPLHWLAEPESSTRTTAEAAGTPTFKSLQARQRLFLALLKDILAIVVERRAQRRGDVDPRASITVTAADISERDNAALALASTQVVASFGQLWANGFIDADEYLRVVYRFAGEVLPSARPDNPQPRVQPAGAAPAARPSSNPAGPYLKTDAATGNVRTEEPR